MVRKICLIWGCCEATITWNSSKRDFVVQGCICVGVPYVITDSDVERVADLDKTEKKRLTDMLVEQHQNGVQFPEVGHALALIHEVTFC